MIAREIEVALRVACPGCYALAGRPCRGENRHALKGCHALRWKAAYQQIADERAARAELEPLMPAVERLVEMQEGPWAA